MEIVPADDGVFDEPVAGFGDLLILLVGVAANRAYPSAPPAR